MVKPDPNCTGESTRGNELGKWANEENEGSIIDDFEMGTSISRIYPKQITSVIHQITFMISAIFQIF